MSQLADLEDVCRDQPMTSEQCAQLFYDALSALDWQIDGVNTPKDAEVYLFDLR